MPPRAERLPVLHHGHATGGLLVEKLPDHVLGGGTAQHRHLRVLPHHVGDLCGVIRLHVVHHQIVGGFPLQRVRHVLPERAPHSVVHRVEQHRFLVLQHIAVVAHAVRHAEHTFKQGETAAVRAHPRIIIIDLSRAIHNFIILSTDFAVEFVHFHPHYSKAHRIFPLFLALCA